MQGNISFGERTLSPKQVNLNLRNLSKWKNLRSELDKGSVSLAKRYQGCQVNRLSNSKCKVMSLAIMNPSEVSVEDRDSSSIYAFDYWQYVDILVYWDGIVPTADVINSSHRNGVPVYGTLFFNWSTSDRDNRIYKDFLRESVDSTRRFENTLHLAEIAKYYGFDGYFINQETTGYLTEGSGEVMRDFILELKEISRKINHPLSVAWYDAMASDGVRHHYDEVNNKNDLFVKPVDGMVPCDEFFINFNWTTEKVENTSKHMESINRSPYAAYCGFELQQNSYKTYINRDALVDENGQAKLSIGLFTPDSIFGLADSASSYHKHEDKFWTGFEEDPSTSDDSNSWSGISRFTSDKTAITSLPFNTYFNTGHGDKYFHKGKLVLDGSWNNRSVQDIMPTWRYYLREGNRDSLVAGYDFSDSYCGGTCLSFKNLDNSRNELLLYSTKLEITDRTYAKFTYKLKGQARVNLYLSSDYNKEEIYSCVLEESSTWIEKVFNIAELAGRTIYAVGLEFNGELKLGQLAFYEEGLEVGVASNVKLEESLLHSGIEKEAVLSFETASNIKHTEVYYEYGDGDYRFAGANSGSSVYLPRLRRSKDFVGTSQKLYLITQGEDGSFSDKVEFVLDWGIEVNDTTPAKNPLNIVPGAKVLEVSSQTTAERAENALTGTITSNADKWTAETKTAHLDIELTKERTVRRIVIEHAGFGGEDVETGSMNTKAFDILYKDRNGSFKLAYSVKNNKNHVTDITLEEGITAKVWRLDIKERDNGTPWGAVRIYNWKMYEEALVESKNIEMSQVRLWQVSGNSYAMSFNGVRKNKTINLYKDRACSKLLASKKAICEGVLTFSKLELEEKLGKVYYRTKEASLEESNILVKTYQDEGLVLEEVEFTPFNKLTYYKGEELDLFGGSLLLKYNKEEVEVELTSPLVEIKGYSFDKLGRQELDVLYLEEKVGTVEVSVLEERELAGIDVKLGKAVYEQGESLAGIELELIYEDESREFAGDLEGLVIKGYNKSRQGEQVVEFIYGMYSKRLKVEVIAPTINTQRLDQVLARYAGIGESNPGLDSLVEIAVSELENLDNSSQERIDELTAKLVEGLQKYL